MATGETTNAISCHKPILLHLPILALNKSPCLPVKKSSFFSKFVAKITMLGTQLSLGDFSPRIFLGIIQWYSLPVQSWIRWEFQDPKMISKKSYCTVIYKPWKFKTHVLLKSRPKTGWPKNFWLVVDLPLWKIWVHQLGSLFPIYGKQLESHKIHVPNHQPVMINHY